MFMGGVHRSYPAIVPPGIPFGRNMGTLPESLYGRRWNVEGIQRDDEASATAKELLARVGRPGATTAEMKALGGNFRCGRCTEPLPDNWEAMVLHYTKERLRWKLVQERMREDPQSGFVYHDIHALSPSNAKPFAHYMTPQAAEEFITEHTSQVPYMMVCRLCERMGIEATFFHTLGGEVESPMVAHLRNVHDIAQAVPGQHFQRWMHDFNIFDPTSSEDEEGEDDEDDEDEFWEW
ncbi:hypothetical protein FRC07_013357 [Ceratobasidium sp. 392]|nr:hypothetical protein FRC07_013357 [Ceratobasidium sp. 392]